MLLVDVGNTSIHFALSRGGKTVKTWRLDTGSATLAGIKLSIAGAMNRAPTRTDAPIMVCSVVPWVTKLFQKISGTRIVGRDIAVPIKSLYNSKQIGQDRLVAAYAARKLYPAARIVIDFGTAVTMDFLSAQGVYEGGIILPGIGSTMRVLSGCAMLPKKMRLKRVRAAIPRDTETSIDKGIEAGFAAMVNGVVADYNRVLKIPKSAPVVITGGEGDFLAPDLKFKYTIDNVLIFKGLLLLSDSL